MGKKDEPSESWKEGHRDGYENKDWHYSNPGKSGAGLGPDKPERQGDSDYNKGVDTGREDRTNKNK